MSRGLLSIVGASLYSAPSQGVEWWKRATVVVLPPWLVRAWVGVTEFAVGDRVTSHFYAEWHEGPWLAEYTDQQIGGPLNGGLAEYQVLAAANVVPTPAYADAAGEAQKRLGIGQSVNGRP